MSNKPEQLQTLDVAALATVTGGTTDADLMTALSSIVTSLQGLATQPSNSMNPQTMMMMMMMMEQRNQQAPVAVAAPNPYYPTAPGGGWYY